ncbi:MAG TPA: hypothetical protein VI300_00905, partial [Solirubrobacter sp.]
MVLIHRIEAERGHEVMRCCLAGDCRPVSPENSTHHDALSWQSRTPPPMRRDRNAHAASATTSSDARRP